MSEPRCITTDKGYTMFLDDRDSLFLSKYGHYEETITHIIDSLLDVGDTFLDIGAHIGYYTIIASKIVGETGKVFAFEPDPTNFALLKKNVEENKCNNVTLVNKAVLNKNSVAKLYICVNNTGDHRVYDNHGLDSIDVKTIRLDDYFKDHVGSIDFIKMDIQGAEGLATDGMHSILQKNKNVKMVAEFAPSMIAQTGSDPKTFLKSITGNGSELYYISQLKINIVKVSIDEILEACTNPRAIANLLCMKNLIIQDRSV